MTSRNNSPQAGFTLLEMLVVIAVMGLIMGLVVTFGPAQNHWLETKGAAQSVATAMAQARGAAITTGQPAALRLPALPPWLGVSVTGTSGAIIFEPDGSCTGGTVTLNDAGRRVGITADWLTARITINAE
jgi:general secretion pathway protein H